MCCGEECVAEHTLLLPIPFHRGVLAAFMLFPQIMLHKTGDHMRVRGCFWFLCFLSFFENLGFMLAVAYRSICLDLYVLTSSIVLQKPRGVG